MQRIAPSIFGNAAIVLRRDTAADPMSALIARRATREGQSPQCQRQRIPGFVALLSMHA